MQPHHVGLRGKMEPTYTANIRVQDLPAKTDRILNALCGVTGKLKWEIVRDALNEYAENHKAELADIAAQ